jgi:subtilisin-like proprotein convertase family protein
MVQARSGNRGHTGLTAVVVTVGALMLGPVAAQAAPVTFSYSGPPIPIPDAGPMVSAPIVVSGLGVATTDVNVSIDGTACTTVVGATTVGIDHEFVGDLSMSLTSPYGTTQPVIIFTGGSGNNFCKVLIDDDASAPSIQSATSAQAPFTGTWTPPPMYPLSLFDGQNPNGTWNLNVQDFASADTGSVRAVSIVVDSGPSPVLANHPAGYWRFGDTAPSTVLPDSSGHANNGTYLGGVTLGQPGAITGDPNTAASFDGVNDTGRVPDSATLDVGDSFAVEGWVKRSSTTKATELFNKGANGLQLTVMNAGSGNQVWLRKAGVTTIARSTAGVPADGAYHHIVATKDGPGSTMIYIDGLDAGTVQVSGGQVVQNTAFPLTFGGAGSTPTLFDDFALYDGVLNPGQVAAHHAAGVSAPT